MVLQEVGAPDVGAGVAARRSGVGEDQPRLELGEGEDDGTGDHGEGDDRFHRRLGREADSGRIHDPLPHGVDRRPGTWHGPHLVIPAERGGIASYFAATSSRTEGRVTRSPPRSHQRFSHVEQECMVTSWSWTRRPISTNVVDRQVGQVIVNPL
jgi:hypothetical protein